MAGETVETQRLFLWFMCVVYFFAFSSLYFQVPGLYGRNGLLPAVKQLDYSCHDEDDRCVEHATPDACDAWLHSKCMLSCGVCKKGEKISLHYQMYRKLTLLWLSPFIGLDTESGMEFLCLLGMLLSISGVVWDHFRNKLVFLALWSFYFSLFQVGETFIWFQWDLLLLETGFITIFLAPLMASEAHDPGPHHNLFFWLIKWLLFRLMFASGVVKLTSGCPTWWGLTALNWHYQSQCIPTPLAWYAHQLPDILQRLSVVATYVIEIGLPFFFFVPVRMWRIKAFYGQVLLQVLIILTGNYNFFNILTLALCYSLVDDEYLHSCTPRWLRSYFNMEARVRRARRNIYVDYLLITLNTLLFFTSAYWIIKLFGIKMLEDGTLVSQITFSKEQFTKSVAWLTRNSLYMGVCSLTIVTLQTLYTSAVREIPNRFKRFVSQVVTMASCGFTVWLFSMSLVSLTSIDQGLQSELWPIIKHWYVGYRKYEITNSYGLFRSMTGVEGRPEIIIEGSDDWRKGPWKEYEFMYKPGIVNQSLPFVAPHQPRLDWQMWFAALGTYQQNPWYIHLIYKLLKGEKDVLQLFRKNPFPDKPPIYIRSQLYTYHYTTLSKQTTGVVDALLRARRIQDVWRRDSPKEYTPALSVHDKSLKNYIESMGVMDDQLTKEYPGGRLFLVLQVIRLIAGKMNPTLFMVQAIVFAVLPKFFR